jgi:hypothetical protein
MQRPITVPSNTLRAANGVVVPPAFALGDSHISKHHDKSMGCSHRLGAYQACTRSPANPKDADADLRLSNMSQSIFRLRHYLCACPSAFAGVGMPDVVVCHSSAAALLHGQARLGAVERLDLVDLLRSSTLIDRQHHGVGRRIDIEPDDLLCTPDELGVRAKEAIPPSCGDGSKAAILNQMQIEENRLREFGRIYKETYDQDITLAEAREMAQRLLTLYDILRRPLPGDGRESSSPDSPAQTEP